MAQITINIPDAVLPRVINAFAAMYGYQATINGQPNPVTKPQFAKQKVIEYVRRVVADTEGGAAQVAAQAQANIDIALT